MKKLLLGLIPLLLIVNVYATPISRLEGEETEEKVKVIDLEPMIMSITMIVVVATVKIIYYKKKRG